MPVRQESPDGPPPFRSGLWLVLLPLTLMAVVAVADILSPADIHLGPLLVVAPAITASFAGPRLTAAIGALSVAALVFIGIERDVITTLNLQVQIASLTVISVIVVLFDYLQERGRRELDRVRTVSEAAQGVLLRPLPPRMGPLRLASHYRAAASDARIGGDLFAAARTAGATRLIIGDVRGKGLESLGDTAMLVGAFRAAAHQQSPLPVLAGYLEGSVSWGLAELAADGGHRDGLEVGEGFVTAVLVDVHDDRPALTLIDCGHPPPLVLHHGRAAALEVERPSPPLGLGRLSDLPYTAADFPFGAGDVLLLYTDGVSEARDARGAFYPLAERLQRLATDDPELLLARIMADLDAYAVGPLGDDVAMVAVVREPPAQGRVGYGVFRPM